MSPASYRSHHLPRQHLETHIPISQQTDTLQTHLFPKPWPVHILTRQGTTEMLIPSQRYLASTPIGENSDAIAPSLRLTDMYSPEISPWWRCHSYRRRDNISDVGGECSCKCYKCRVDVLPLMAVIR